MVLAIGRFNNKDNSRRKFMGGGPRPDYRALKQKEAKERQEAWSKLTPQEQLKALDRRPGKSERQRARILAAVRSAKNAMHSNTSQKQDVSTTNDGDRVKAKDRRAQERKDRPSK